jgi:hypothetical protein
MVSNSTQIARRSRIVLDQYLGPPIGYSSALETVATVEDRAVAEVISAAITAHIENCRKDEHFQDSLKERIERAQRRLGK